MKAKQFSDLLDMPNQFWYCRYIYSNVYFCELFVVYFSFRWGPHSRCAAFRSSQVKAVGDPTTEQSRPSSSRSPILMISLLLPIPIDQFQEKIHIPNEEMWHSHAVQALLFLPGCRVRTKPSIRRRVPGGCWPSHGLVDVGPRDLAGWAAVWLLDGR